MAAGQADGEIADAATAGEGVGEGVSLQLCESAGIDVDLGAGGDGQRFLGDVGDLMGQQ